MPTKLEVIMALDIQDNHDGCHTFRELYECRHALYLCLANAYATYFRKSEKDNHYSGWFLVWGNIPQDAITIGEFAKTAQVSFHIPNKYYDMFKLKIESSEYDGHSTKDVIERLIKFGVS